MLRISSAFTWAKLTSPSTTKTLKSRIAVRLLNKMPYWIVSLPLLESKERTWNTLQQRTVYEQDIAFNSRLDIPELKMGTLDSLMVLSDEMVRACQSMDSVVGKLKRTLTDMVPGEEDSLRVQGQTLESYIQKFRWNEAKYPVRRSLKETVDALGAEVQSIEEDLKGRLQDYNALKQQLGQIARKAQGSLAVRDLTSLLERRELVDTENLQTVFVIVSKFSTTEWTSSYEQLVPAQEGRPSFIVPRSSKLAAEDNEYAAFSVVIFKRVLDDFKLAARAKGFQVREVDLHSAAAVKPEEVEALRQDADRKRAALEEWLRTAFSEAFACLMHAMSVRLYVESVLRYGVPPRFLAAVVRPHPKVEATVRKVLAQTFGGADARYWTNAAEDSRAGMSDGDVFPYVSLVLNAD